MDPSSRDGAYEKPTLVTYGTIQELTEEGRGDGNGPPSGVPPVGGGGPGGVPGGGPPF